jgi:hypothetical protein
MVSSGLFRDVLEILGAREALKHADRGDDAI